MIARSKKKFNKGFDSEMQLFCQIYIRYIQVKYHTLVTTSICYSCDLFSLISMYYVLNTLILEIHIYTPCDMHESLYEENKINFRHLAIYDIWFRFEFHLHRVKRKMFRFNWIYIGKTQTTIINMMCNFIFYFLGKTRRILDWNQ